MGNELTKQEQELNAFERVRVARHPERPYSLDLFGSIFEDFLEIHGDRRFSDDPALVCGLARLEKSEVVVIGHQKGRDTNQRRMRNFGMPKPEGYRKALRVMKFAEKFARPVITFVDTPGAYPGIDAEERGQAEAIARNLLEMAGLKVPTIVVIIGEGGSGGALAIGLGNRVLMLENAIYSVISPEGCAAILWKDAARAEQAASSLRLTAGNLLELGLIDEIIREKTQWRVPVGEESNGDPQLPEVSLTLKRALVGNLDQLKGLTEDEIIRQRQDKFRHMGRWLSLTV